MIEHFLSYYGDPMFSRAKCVNPSSEFKTNLILSFLCTQHDPYFSLHCPHQGLSPVQDTATDKPGAVIEHIITYTLTPTTECYYK